MKIEDLYKIITERVNKKRKFYTNELLKSGSKKDSPEVW